MNNMHKWSGWVQEIFWALFNAWIWVKDRVHPLTEEEKAANMAELLAGPQDEAPE